MAEKNSKEKAIIVFQDKEVRRTWHQDEWWFSITDIIQILADTTRPRKYWNDLKLKLKKDENFEVSGNIGQLKLVALDGKLRETDCANVETLFRIIQSIPSPNANKFKLWLARIGYDRIKEIENPELAQDRAKKYYELKGYPPAWIEKRLRGIAIRQELTEEWSERGVKEDKEYAILTNEINKVTFGISIKKHKQIKSMDPKFRNQNLRDNMNDLELIFNMLGEKVTTEITKKKDSQVFPECQDAAQRGGKVAGNARKETEKEIGKKVVSSDNYLDISGKRKKLIKSKK